MLGIRYFVIALGHIANIVLLVQIKGVELARVGEKLDRLARTDACVWLYPSDDALVALDRGDDDSFRA